MLARHTLFATLLLLSSCTPAGPAALPEPAPVAPAPQAPVPEADPVEVPLSAQQLASRFGPSVWRVEAESCGGDPAIGSSFLVAPGVLLTSAHVVEYASAVSVTGRSGGTTLPATVLGVSRTQDVALLRVEGLQGVPLEWVPAAELQEGQPVVSLGFPSPLHVFSVTPGTLNAFVEEAGVRTGVVSDDASDFGSSGGPLLTTSGRVAGVVTEFLGGTQLSGLSLSFEALESELEAIRAGLRPYDLPSCVLPDFQQAADLLAIWCGGDLPWACDLLLSYMEEGTDGYELAYTCGRMLSFEEVADRWCTDIFPSAAVPFTYGDFAPLDAVQDDCSSSEPSAAAACDLLLLVSPPSSEYETFGLSCGGRFLSEEVGELWCQEML